MDLHVPAPSSSDGIYEMTDPAPPVVGPAPVPAQSVAPAPPSPEITEVAAETAAVPQPVPAPAAKPGRGFGSFWKRSKTPAQTALADGEVGEAKATAKPKKRKRRRRLHYVVPSWAVSVLVHVVVLTTLGLATFSTEVRKAVANINSALVSGKGAAEEELHVLATPTEDRGDSAVGSEGSPTAGGGGGGGGGGMSGIGTGPPSATPRVTGVGKGIGDGNSLPGVKVVAQVSGLNLLPTAAKLGVDLGGGGMIGGNITFEAKDVGEALDQLAREILRHLSQHKLTVVWLFDESESMKDDQRAVRDRFDSVATALKVNVDTGKKQAAALNHAIVGFGKNLHYELRKPTANIDDIGRAIERLQVDDTGTENTMHAIGEVIQTYSSVISKDRRLLLVLVTDESGDDGSYIEEAYQAAMTHRVPIYIIGRQSLFGYERAHLRYVDPVTKDVYWPAIRRGPETADVEMLQYDGLHERWDEQPSGFAPYELGRLAKGTGGIYFLLPSEENMRVRQREKLYSMKTLKEYVPENDNRVDYISRRNKSEFRRSLYEIIQLTRRKSAEDPGFIFRREYPIFPQELRAVCEHEYMVAGVKVKALMDIQKRLEGLKKLRDREPLKRWQAHYDLMLAQIVAYQVKAYEYRACVKELGQTLPKPKKMPTPDLEVVWVIDHSHDRKAPKEETDKKYAEATALLKKVIAMHPNTPWADLAQDELNRGLGCQRGEWDRNPKYNERAKLVPKY